MTRHRALWSFGTARYLPFPFREVGNGTNTAFTLAIVIAPCRYSRRTRSAWGHLRRAQGGDQSMPSVSIKGLTSKRGLLALGISVGVVAATVGAAAAQGTPHASPAAGGPSHNVIVLLRNQHTNLAITKGHSSARVNAFRADQSPLMSHAKTDGAKNLHGFATVN